MKKSWSQKKTGMLCAVILSSLMITAFSLAVREREYNELDCVLPDGETLSNGSQKNSTDPCVNYDCHNGSYFTEGCDKPKDSFCSESYGGVGPYPDCCPAILCT
uniref:8.9 kDa family member n=1 Tax=Rhipicephalus appendiculatus TaxID=34631 RepID=A0A131YU66_RHIAP